MMIMKSKTILKNKNSNNSNNKIAKHNKIRLQQQQQRRPIDNGVESGVVLYVFGQSGEGV